MKETTLEFWLFDESHDMSCMFDLSLAAGSSSAIRHTQSSVRGYMFKVLIKDNLPNLNIL